MPKDEALPQNADGGTTASQQERARIYGKAKVETGELFATLKAAVKQACEELGVPRRDRKEVEKCALSIYVSFGGGIARHH